MSLRSKHHVYTNNEILASLPTPVSTETYCGIPHKQLFDLSMEVSQEFGLIHMRDRIEVTHQGQRAYMVQFFEAFEGHPLAIGLRSTYDKSASVAIAGGPSVAICSNQSIHGEDITLFRKHTKNAEQELGDLFREAFTASTARYDERIKWLLDLKTMEVTQQQGLMIIGAMGATNVIEHGSVKKARNHWLNPPFEEFDGENNLYGGQNALTWAFHDVRPAKKLETHKKMNEFIDRVSIKDKQLILA